MVNPGAFQGARKAFLMGEKEIYSQAVDDGHVAEAVAKIQRRFFKRFPIDLPDEVEPTDEELEAVNDDEIEPDYKEPDPEKMTEEDYKQAMVVLEERRRRISFRRGQIKRWLAYQYTKDHDVDTKSSGAHNPYRALLFKLTGQHFVRPRAKTACNVWRKTKREVIELQVKTIAAQKGVPKSGLATLRDKVARDMFCDLPEEDRRKWKFAAEQESLAALNLWEEEINGPPSTTPEDRQRCILGLVRFMQPVLDLVCEATGWKASFIAGGPEPAHSGKLNIISVHSGKTTGDVPLDFGTLEREWYKKSFLPMYGRFLKKCYSVQECHARALKTEDGLSLEAAEVENEGVGLFSVDEASTTVAKRSQALLDLRLAPASRAPVPRAPAPRPPAPRPPAPRPPAPRAPTPRVPPVLEAIPPQPISAPSSHPTEISSNPSLRTTQLRTLSAPAHSKASSPASCCPHAPAICPDDTDSSDELEVTPPPIIPAPDPPRLPSESRIPITQSLFTPPARATSLPPSPPRTPLPSCPPSPAQSPTPSRLPLPPSPMHDRASPSPASTTQPSSELSCVASLPTGNASSFDAGSQVTGAGSEIPNSAAELSSVSRGPRRSKRRRSITQGTTETRPAKKGKQSKTSSDSVAVDSPELDDPTSVPITTASDAPAWFTTIVAMLQSRGLDQNKQWLDLVTTWSQFESREGYEGASRLSATSRPEVISQWLHRKRSPTFEPAIDLRRYPKTFSEWWTALQPDWRVAGKKIMFENFEGNWERLRRKAGINGFVNVIVALFYWGCTVKEGRKSNREWEQYVNDCQAVLTRLLTLDP